MSRLIPCAIAIGLLASTAGAVQAQDWTGPYLGGHIGYAAGDGNGGESIQFDTDLDGRARDQVTTVAGANAFSPGFCNGRAKTNAPAGGCSEDDDSVDFGVRAGYDWQYGSYVLGVVGELASQEIEDSVSAFSTTPASYSMTRSLSTTAAIRGRAGYAIDKFLIYGTAGAVYGDLESSFRTTNMANQFSRRGADDGVWGAQLGLGGEMKVTDNLSIGIEYLNSRFNDDSFRVRASQGAAPATNPFIQANSQGTDFRRSDDTFQFNTVRATAAWRF